MAIPPSKQFFPTQSSRLWKLHTKFIAGQLQQVRKQGRYRTKSALLRLPVEIRLEIYDLIYPLPRAYKLPVNHPLFPLLSVHPIIRHEVAQICYNTIIFNLSLSDASFLSYHSQVIAPKPSLTLDYTQFITSLSLRASKNDTFSLEPIFRILASPDCQIKLRSLIVSLLPMPGPQESRPRKSEKLPDGMERSVHGHALARIGELKDLYDTDLRNKSAVIKALDYGHVILPPSTVEHSADSSVLALALEEKTNSALGHLRNIRYLAIFGHPVGLWAFEFEIAVIRLLIRMFEIAKEEGVQVKRSDGTWRITGAWWFHNDVWIQGEDLGEKQRQFRWRDMI